MITKDSIETAYSFLHQKQRIYVHSTLDWQKDDIEIAIASYADEMSQELLDVISGGRADFLRDHINAYVSCLHQLYLFGAAMQLNRMGYHMTKIN